MPPCISPTEDPLNRHTPTVSTQRNLSPTPRESSRCLLAPFEPLQRPIQLFHFPQIAGLFFLLANLLRNLRRRQLLLRQLISSPLRFAKSNVNDSVTFPPVFSLEVTPLETIFFATEYPIYIFIPKLAQTRHPPSTCFLNIPLAPPFGVTPSLPCRLALRYPRHLMWMSE